MSGKKNKWSTMSSQLKSMADQEWNKRLGQKDTYTVPLPKASTLSKEKAGQLGDFLFQFKHSWNEKEKEKVLNELPVVKGFYDFLVVNEDRVSEKDFWQRYGYRCNREQILKDFEALPAEDFAKLVEAATEQTKEITSRVYALPTKKTTRPPDALKSPVKPDTPVYDRNALLKKVAPPTEESSPKESSKEHTKEINLVYTEVLKKTNATKSEEDAPSGAPALDQHTEENTAETPEKPETEKVAEPEPSPKVPKPTMPRLDRKGSRPDILMVSPLSSRQSFEADASTGVGIPPLDLSREEMTEQMNSGQVEEAPPSSEVADSTPTLNSLQSESVASTGPTQLSPTKISPSKPTPTMAQLDRKRDHLDVPLVSPLSARQSSTADTSLPSLAPNSDLENENTSEQLPEQKVSSSAPPDIPGVPVSPTTRIPDKDSILSKISDTFLSPGTLRQIETIVDERGTKKESKTETPAISAAVSSFPETDKNVGDTDPLPSGSFSFLVVPKMQDPEDEDIDALDQQDMIQLGPEGAEEAARVMADEEELRLNTEAQARLNGEEDAIQQAQDEDTRLEQEKQLRQHAEEDARIKFNEEQRRLAGEDQERKMAEEHARLKAEEIVNHEDMEKIARDRAEEAARAAMAESSTEKPLDASHRAPAEAPERGEEIRAEASTIEKQLENAPKASETEHLQDVPSTKSTETSEELKVEAMVDKQENEQEKSLVVETISEPVVQESSTTREEPTEESMPMEAEDEEEKEPEKSPIMERINEPAVQEPEVDIMEPVAAVDVIVEAHKNKVALPEKPQHEGVSEEPKVQEDPSKPDESAEGEGGESQIDEQTTMELEAATIGVEIISKSPPENPSVQNFLPLIPTPATKKSNLSVVRRTLQEREEKRQRVKALVQQLDSTLQSHSAAVRS